MQEITIARIAVQDLANYCVNSYRNS